MKSLNHIIIVVALLLNSCSEIKQVQTDVLVIGGGASGVTAALQSARSGVKTLLVEETSWLGGMISAAGVSAFDGNHTIPSGIWNEFREMIYTHYGGPTKVETGWVSNTLFEPHVADRIFKTMVAKEAALVTEFGWTLSNVMKDSNKVQGAQFIHSVTGDKLEVRANVVIDATELGDAIAAAGVVFDVGLEPEVARTEQIEVGNGAGIIQDLTYVAILKDYGKDADCTIVKPRNYSPAEFDGACSDYHTDSSRKKPTVNAQTLLNYGRLPNGKFMLNWPNYGNDFYFNPIGLDRAAQDSGYALAKEQTLRFVYFIQHQLGYRHLGLADDEFPTSDKLALIPYHRESRRIKGVVRFNMLHLAQPFEQATDLYRTGIAVGDYPLDHHHKKNPLAPQQLDFYPVPSFTIPLGALIPATMDGVISAEKNISVSNIINGATRLQPCVMLIGQAAGALAALAVKKGVAPRAVPIRAVQTLLLEQKAMILPYIDVAPTHPQFSSIHRVGATGLLRGKGIPYKWANQTWFYPDQHVNVDTLRSNGKEWLSDFNAKGLWLSIAEAKQLVVQTASLRYGLQLKEEDSVVWSASEAAGIMGMEPTKFITRGQFAVLIDRLIDPFMRVSIDHQGEIQSL